MKTQQLLKNKPVAIYLIAATSLLIILFFDFIFGNKYLLYKDIGNDTYFQIYAYFKDFNHILHLEHWLPQWSFAAGIGQEIPPMYLSSIFQWPLLFINESYIPYGLAITEFFKIITIGLFFLLFLLNRGIHNHLAIAGAIMMMLSGYVLTNTSYYLYWTNSALYFVGGIYAIDKLFDGKIYWLVFFSMMVLVDQPMYFHFFNLTLIYFLIAKKESLKRSVIIRYLFATLTAILLAAPAWVSNIRVMMESTRASEQFSYSGNFNNWSNLMVANGDEIKTNFLKYFGLHFEGFSNYAKSSAIFQETPLYYIGFLILPLFIYIIYQSFKKKNYINGTVLLLVASISFLPILRVSLWLFTGNYNRILSFVIAIIMLTECIIFLNDYFKSKEFKAVPGLALIFAVCILPFVVWYDTDHGILFEKTILLLSVTAMGFYFLPKFKFKTIYLVLVLAIIDQMIEGYLVLNNRIIATMDDLKPGKEFEDYSLDAINWIKKTDQGHFRTEKDYNSGKGLKVSSVNDAMIQHFNGLKVYTSFNNMKYVNYLQNFASIPFENEFETRWLRGFTGNFDILNDLSVKYVISDGSFDWTKVNYKLVYGTGFVQVFENPYFKPFGRVNNNIIPKSKFEALSTEQKMVVRDEYMVMNDIDLDQIVSSGDVNLNDSKVAPTDFHLIKFNNHHFEGTVSNNQFSMLYLPIIHSEVWKVKINNKQVKAYETNYGLLSIPLLPGKNNITIDYETPYFYLLLSTFTLGILLLLIQKNLLTRKKEGAKV